MSGSRPNVMLWWVQFNHLGKVLLTFLTFQGPSSTAHPLTEGTLFFLSITFCGIFTVFIPENWPKDFGIAVIYLSALVDHGAFSINELNLLGGLSLNSTRTENFTIQSIFTGIHDSFTVVDICTYIHSVKWNQSESLSSFLV